MNRTRVKNDIFFLFNETQMRYNSIPGTDQLVIAINYRKIKNHKYYKSPDFSFEGREIWNYFRIQRAYSRAWQKFILDWPATAIKLDLKNWKIRER